MTDRRWAALGINAAGVEMRLKLYNAGEKPRERDARRG